jgi:hypothetical protein
MTRSLSPARLRSFVVAATGLCALAAPAIARADHTIDAFTNQLPNTTLPGSSTPWPGLWAGRLGSSVQASQTASQSGLSGVVGGQRIAKLAEGSETNFVTALIDGSGTLEMSAGLGPSGVVALVYGDTTPLHLNLSGDLNFEFTIDGDEDDSTPARPITLTITLHSTGGSNESHAVSLAHDGTYLIPFSTWSHVNFSSVDFIQFTFDGESQSGVDYDLIGGLKTH